MTYKEVGEKVGLLPETLIRYEKYMRKRWGDPEDEELKCKVGYAREWAERFKMGIEYEMSDGNGKFILEKMKGAGL